MKFDTPAGPNPIDNGVHVGKPTPRIDGPLKTSGQAPYAYEHHDVPGHPAYGFIVPATIAKGRVTALDTAAARAVPGVLAVITAADAGPLAKGKFNTAKLLGGPDVEHYHQALAIVVAETFETARHAASLVRIDYAPAAGRFDLARARAGATVPKDDPDSRVGDFEGAFAAAPVQLDQTYTTPGHSHAAMEPHASIAAWEGGKLTVWSANQMIAWGKNDLAKTFGIAPDNVRMVAPFIGGGFGGKLFPRIDVVAAALAAKRVNRPVKVALPRPLIANNTTHRPATIQRLRLGADKSGKLVAIGHESWSGDLPGGGPEGATAQTKLLYAGVNRFTALRLAEMDLPEGNAMRAPGEAPGLMALEIAMDELAEKLGMDPIALRIANDTQVDPENPARPFSGRQLVECLKQGAAKFGWDQRPAKPGARTDGDFLIGYGVASAFRGNLTMTSGARIRLAPDGRVTVETDMTDIGTGTYTIVAQTAAEMLGVPLDHVTVKLGDSAFPVSAGSGGQWGANSSTAGVYAAAVALRETVCAKLGLDPAKAEFTGGTVRAGNRVEPLAKAAAGGEIVVEDKIEFGDLSKKYAQSTFGAHFAEVGVDRYTGEVRLRRMLAVCAAGRILNPLSARSQVIGAMTMGAGAALMEGLDVDKRFGFFVNHDLAGYEVPVHADVPHQEVVFLDEVDDKSSPMKAKGVGELGICGVAAAIANAIHNATGVRLRDYPMTLDKHLDRLPAV